MKKISVNNLKDFCVKACLASGYDMKDAETIADVLTTTDTFGVVSHGTKNLYEYIRKTQEGGLSVSAKPEIVKEGPAWAIMDGHDAMGMVCGADAMRLAIEKAKQCGIGYVTIDNSCHFGAAGYYANMAAAEGMIGLSMSNADPTMVVPNAKGVSIGNNPFAFAAPLPGGKSVFLDVALSAVAALKVVLAKAKGEPVPDNWLVDLEGNPTTDASGFPYESHLQPMAAHKGYGFAVMVEVLTSVVSMGAMLSAIRSWNLDLATKNAASHAFIAIDASQMISREVLEARMQAMVDELHAAPLAAGKTQVFVPGDMEWMKREKALAEGLVLTDAMTDTLGKLSAMTGVSINWEEI